MSGSYQEISEFLYCLSEKMDEELYENFLSDCDSDFHYQVKAYSPELGKEMIWLDHDINEMRNLMLMIHQHVRMKGRFTRNVSMLRIKETATDHYDIRSQFLVMHTDLYGTTKVFATGTYNDKVIRKQQGFYLKDRKVYLQTRDLGPGVHVPI